METAKSKFILTLGLVIAISSSFAKSTHQHYDHRISIQINQENNDLKYGQYVYVTLKDGSQTVGKIAGKKNSKKYYVNQLNGSNHGLVHVRYIRKMTKEEIEKYKSNQKDKDS